MVKAAVCQSSPESNGEENMSITLNDMHNLLQSDKNRKHQVNVKMKKDRKSSAFSRIGMLFDELNDGPLKAVVADASDIKRDTKSAAPNRFSLVTGRLLYQKKSSDISTDRSSTI